MVSNEFHYFLFLNMQARLNKRLVQMYEPTVDDHIVPIAGSQTARDLIILSAKYKDYSLGSP